MFYDYLAEITALYVFRICIFYGDLQLCRVLLVSVFCSQFICLSCLRLLNLQMVGVIIFLWVFFHPLLRDNKPTFPATNCEVTILLFTYMLSGLLSYWTYYPVLVLQMYVWGPFHLGWLPMWKLCFTGGWERLLARLIVHGDYRTVFVLVLKPDLYSGSGVWTTCTFLMSCEGELTGGF